MIDRFSCFICADLAKYIDRTIDAVCETCGREYGFPLSLLPRTISNFKVIKSLGRGYYSATYKAQHPVFRNRVVALKVIPKKIYLSHEKNFAEECQQHNQIAEGSQHIVQIDDYFDAPIVFGDVELDCHVEVLELVNGFALEKVIDCEMQITATECTQVAIDLFTILWEFNEKDVRHNDLHGGNVVLERLSKGQHRLDAVDPTVRVKAIDINSAGDRFEPYLDDRRRDVQRVAALIRRLVRPLLIAPEPTNDLAVRALNKLLDVANFIDTTYQDNRSLTYPDIVSIIKTEFHESQSAVSPWFKDISLRRMNEYYNAQALEPWFASHFFVDPEDSWLPAVSAVGPQLITGMRGCGKTILLKSLQFHARANHPSDKSARERINRLSNDRYIGLYVSSSRLTDIGDDQHHNDAISILFLGFVKSALEAIRHLLDIDPQSVKGPYHELFVHLLREVIPSSAVNIDGIINATFLNIEIEKMQYSLYRRDSTFRISMEPAVAFRSLAKAVRAAVKLWANHHVLFLLDDVSTRYVNVDRIAKLISQLLVQNHIYSFKFTSEEHTIRYVLHSPGNIENARAGRDYDAFDLGKNVREKIHGSNSKGRKKFVQDILIKRLTHLHSGLLNRDLLPRNLLGDVSLEGLARTIGSTARTSSDRKKVYSGFSVLIGMCVGDIGDILNVYDRFLQLSEQGKSLKQGDQSQVYLDFCSLRLYDLKRLRTDMETYARGFAKAAHTRLVESVRNLPDSGRIRQYNSIYVRITSNDSDEQKVMLQRINQMIDSGIFVSAGLALRAKTKDPNPLLQFILVFRKIFGLTHFIGLSERDRFELSGDELKRWLENPADCEAVLLASPHVEDPQGADPDDDSDADDELIDSLPESRAESGQSRLFEDMSNAMPGVTVATAPVDSFLGQVVPESEVSSGTTTLTGSNIDTLILALGFESRAVESLKSYIDLINPSKIYAFEYPIAHNSPAMLELLTERYGSDIISILPYSDLGRGLEHIVGTTLVDVSGMSKALIFGASRAISNPGQTSYFAHMESSSYYPTDAELKAVIDTHDEANPSRFLESLDEILGGEVGPYEKWELGGGEADEARTRVLIAFAKPKNERLYHVLDTRDFDRIELVTPKGDSSPRSYVSRIVAGIVSRKFVNTATVGIDANDISGTLRFIADRFHNYYIQLNANVEIALTGSKRQTIAIGLLSPRCKFSKVWYVKPSDIDEKRFSTGLGDMNFIKVTVP